MNRQPHLYSVLGPSETVLAAVKRAAAQSKVLELSRNLRMARRMLTVWRAGWAGRTALAGGARSASQNRGTKEEGALLSLSSHLRVALLASSRVQPAQLLDPLPKEGSAAASLSLSRDLQQERECSAFKRGWLSLYRWRTRPPAASSSRTRASHPGRQRRPAPAVSCWQQWTRPTPWAASGGPSWASPPWMW